SQVFGDGLSHPPETEPEPEPEPPPPEPEAAPLPRTGDASEELPYEVIPEEHTLADLVRIASTSPNPLQRAEIMLMLASHPGAARAGRVRRPLRGLPQL